MDLSTFCFPVQLENGRFSGLFLNLPAYAGHPRKLRGFFGSGTRHSGFEKVVLWEDGIVESSGGTKADQHGKGSITQDGSNIV